MKRVFAAIIILAASLPLMATPASCQNSQFEAADLANGALLFVNPECLENAGVDSPWN